MRKFNLRLLCLQGFFCLGGLGLLQAQALYRVTPSLPTAKISETSDLLPCGGTTLFEEGFESGLPVGWTVIDGDDRTPRPEMQLQKGWQGHSDYRDSLNNKVVVSPSWYVDQGQSNDWLITPLIVVGNNSCLSWKAYSQDGSYKEAYEVRIALAADTTSFLANAALITVAAESGTPSYSSASLAAYAGQSVYIAFRQTSDDKFVLCLDEVKVSNVNAVDIGVYGITYGSPELGDTVRMKFQVANYGSDTITSFQAFYAVDGGTPQQMNITAVSLPPNSTVTFTHDSLYISDSVDAFHPLCGWTNLPNAVTDQDISNDSSCVSMAIGHPVSVADAQLASGSMHVYPNPFSDVVHLRVQGLKHAQSAQLVVRDLQGQTQFMQQVRLENGYDLALDLSALSAGMYIATVEVSAGNRLQVKFIKQ